MSFNIYEDNRAGLMPQIQALIAPPSLDKSTDKKHADRHPYFKRPGRGHNHDLCDCCGEGGDLICCDKCPSSFHLQCHDPPLDESHIPLGDWLCHKCKYISSKQKMNESSKSRNCMDVLIEAARLVNPKLFELPYELTQPCDFPGTDKVLLPYIRSHHHQRRPYSLSIAPSLFRYTTTSSSSSIYPSHHSTSSQSTTSAIPGNSSALQPLAGRCYECRRSCLSSPLLKCDYCSLHWHLDCLRPPLAAPPAVRWMCPNHVEHALDAKLLTSASATERTRIWNAFKAPVDQQAIKLAFFRKIHRKNPPFHFRVRYNNRRKKACVIPRMVKDHYRQPVALLPSLRDAIREETVRSRLNNIENYFQDYCDISNDINDLKDVIDPVKSPNNTSELQEFSEITKKIDTDICNINKDIDDISNDIIKINSEETNDNNIKSDSLTNDKTAESDVPQINTDLLHNLQSCNTVWKLDRDSEAFLTEVLLENERRQKKLQDEQRGDEMEQVQNGCHVKQEEKKEINEMDYQNGENGLIYLNNVDVVEANYLQLRQLDIHLLRVLALQRIQQLITTPTNTTSMHLPSQLLTAEDIERIAKAFNGGVYNDVSKVPLPHHYAPAHKQQAQTLLCPMESGRPQCGGGANGRKGVRGKGGSCVVRARAMLCPVISKYFYNVRTQDVDAIDVRHDASFMGYRPTVSARFPEATAMRYRCITIGRGVANDLQLDRYGHCNYISAKHAVIFYDEHTKHYELLNYSLYGTSVNNVRYCNDNTVAGNSNVNCCNLQQSGDETTSAHSTDGNVTNMGGNVNCTSNSSLMEKQIVRDIIEKRRKMVLNCGLGQGAGRKIIVNDCKMAAIDMADRMDCSCAGNPSINNNIADVTATGPTTTAYNRAAVDSKDRDSGADTAGAFVGAGWEGSAILTHGALVRFGCIAFVFSIVDCATV